MKETKSEEKELFTSRKSTLDKVDQKYYRAYEKIRGAHDGISVVNIHSSSCGNCYSQLPPQIVIEIKSNNNIINCQICSSFLYWDKVSL